MRNPNSLPRNRGMGLPEVRTRKRLFPRLSPIRKERAGKLDMVLENLANLANLVKIRTAQKLQALKLGNIKTWLVKYLASHFKDLASKWGIK